MVGTVIHSIGHIEATRKLTQTLEHLMQCNCMHYVMMGNDISLSVNMLDHGIQVALAHTMTAQEAANQ
jgi:hypothetical protein